MNINEKIQALDGPILVIGASGFIGSNIFRSIHKNRKDIFGTSFSGAGWRLEDLESNSIIHLNKCDKQNFIDVINKIKPKTIFDCSSFGAYSFENDYELIHKTNFLSLIDIFKILQDKEITSFIHAGSSSEYGLNSNQPDESSELLPNSQYAISKAAASNVIKYYGKIKKFPALNLRLYSVYGPYEDSSRLIPVLCKSVFDKKLPPFASESISRDFIYIDDVVDAFITASLNINPSIYGQSFNIGTGQEIQLKNVAEVAKRIFGIKDTPQFSDKIRRNWDTEKWFAKTLKTEDLLNWKYSIDFEKGLKLTYDWWSNRIPSEKFERLTKKGQLKEKNSISAIIACYKDVEAIPIMYERLVKTFNDNNIDYEIIFVNDCSPDDSHSVIKSLSSKDPRVIGITHSRNFGSQAAFLSGMEMFNKEACVLLDGDLQDPPELINNFITEWRKGFDIVYGTRVKREMPFYLEGFYKLFYFLFDKMSNLNIPRNAGDFSLIDRKAARWIVECGERDFFLRGIRAYVGFNQIGVEYIRAERMFGKSTNNWIKNIGWAKKAIFSFSNLPLHIITNIGIYTTFITFCIACYSIFIRFYNPTNIPQGITFLSLMIMFFGSLSILGLGLLGEYIGKILEETKHRPRYIRNKIIIRGNEKEIL